MDITIDPKILNRFRSKHQRTIQSLGHKLTNLDSTEIDVLVSIYVKLMEDNGPAATHMSRTQLRSMLYQVFDMPEDHLVERIMVAIDRGITPYIKLSTFVTTMSIFLRGSLADRIRYCYAVYDILGEKMIKRDQLIILLRNAVIKQHAEDVEEIVKDMVDMLIKKVDLDLDGAISMQDYTDTVMGQPALLEIFGHCLPSRESVNAYLHTFTHKIEKF